MQFFKKLERIFINLMVITLIFLISFQLVMKNEEAYQKIKNYEMMVKGFFNNNQQAIEVINPIYDEVNNEAGIVAIEILGGFKLPQVWVIINGEKISNFENSLIELSVNESDLIEIDSRNYPDVLWFEIKYLSPSIYSWNIGQQFRFYQEIRKIGVVETYRKL